MASEPLKGGGPSAYPARTYCHPGWRHAEWQLDGEHMNNKAIVSLVIGEGTQNMFDSYFKSSWELYAAKHGYDIVLIDEIIDTTASSRNNGDDGLSPGQVGGRGAGRHASRAQANSGRRH